MDGVNDFSGYSQGIAFGDGPLSIDDIWALSTGQVALRLTTKEPALAAIARSAGHVEATLAREGVIYGVTTGYGDSVTRGVPNPLVTELPLHLTRFHGCGLGRILDPHETRAVMAVRLVTLMRGWSGVSLDLVRLLSDMLRLDILPLIPAEGSVGASGDLTPLSYIAGALAGERDVLYNGQVMSSAEAFAKAGLSPIKL
jgi:histidine ammonia-lyase